MKGKKEQVQPSNTFECLACKVGQMQREQFLEHIRTVHNYQKAQSTRSLVQALDGSDWYSNVFEWTIPLPDGTKIKALQCSSGPRHKHDMMRHDDE